MKRKKNFLRMLLLLLIATVGGANELFAQSEIPEVNGERVIMAEGDYYLPSGWIVPSGQTPIIYNLKIDKSSVNNCQNVNVHVQGWTNVLRLYPTGYGAGNQGLNVPGSYSILDNNGGGSVSMHVIYTDDPWIILDGNTLSKNKLSSYTQPIDAQSSVSLEVGSSYFLPGGGGSTKLYKRQSNGSWGNHIAENQALYTITTSGEYGYLIMDGSTNPATRVMFGVNVTPPTTYTISTAASPANGGSTSGGGSYQSGTAVTVSATVNQGYQFTNWTENGTEVSTSANYTFTVSGDRNLVANFQTSTVPVTGVTLNETSLTKTVGDAHETLIATVSPSNATNKAVTWATSDANVATVIYGVVRFVGAGEAVITVTTQDGNFAATCAVSVQPVAVAVTGVTLNKTSLSKTVGDAAETLTATVAPENATDKAVTWSTDNASVAKVSNGTVNFFGVGTATITVTTQDGNFTATCAVSVQPVTVAVTGVTLNKTSLSKTVGDAAETLTATVAPENATDKAVTWTSSDVSVATVNNGTVSFVGAGTATITVTTQDGGKTATCAVTVQAAAIPVTSVTLNKTTLSKMVGDAAETLTATVAPENATDKAVTWSTDNTDVVTVTDGVVNFVGAGTATITVTTQDGGKTATCAVTVQALPPVPVFDGLEEEYFVGSPAVTLKVKGVGSEKLTVFKVNGQDVTAFNPVAKGTYKVEAVSPDGKLKIYRIIIVK